jgi:diguanylate cyclase (GGDEF)-like protein
VTEGPEQKSGVSLEEERLLYLAGHDPLTGLLNRRRFRFDLEGCAAFSSRYGGRCAVFVLAVDGGDPDDEALRRVASGLARRVRETDSVARLSGCEFAVLLPQTALLGALRLAEDLREVAAQAAKGDGGEGFDVSVGVASFGPESIAGPEAILVAADLALQRAREEGSGVVAQEAPPEGDATRPRRATAAGIRQAIADDRLSLDIQPIFDLGSGAVSAHELLLRMHENGGDPMPAADFIRIAEEAGMAQELDRWVAGRAIELLARHEAEESPISLHVNLSGASVGDPAVIEYIERRLDEEGVDPSSITFEITETTPIPDVEAAAVFADRLAELGCGIALDDYGAGFGPFQYLRQLPFDLIKIDGDFIRDLPRNDADQLTVQAIVRIARGLGKKTIAGFVQDDETAEMLRSYGVDMAQGFHLGRPVDVAGSLS